MGFTYLCTSPSNVIQQIFRDADFRYDHVVEPIDARRDGYLDEIYLPTSS